MSDPFKGKDAGMYVGEVVLGVKELTAAVEAAERLLGHVYDNVKITMDGDPTKAEAMAKDIYKIARMLLKVTHAVTGARLVAGSNSEVH